MASTSRGQRIGIWVITVTMIVGTIMSFAVIIIANNNQQNESKTQQEKYNKFQTAMSEYQAKVDAQTAELSGKYYETMKAYASYPAAFDKDAVKEVTTKDLTVGTGAELTKDTSYNAYYIGWNPEGKIFDQSIDTTTNKLKAPISGTGLISGWTEGVVGMKFGGVREITIPSSKAYGSAGSGDLIAPYTPIKFIVMVIEPTETFAQPDVSEYLK